VDKIPVAEITEYKYTAALLRYLSKEFLMASLDFEKERDFFYKYYESNYQILEAARSTFASLIKSLLSENENCSIQLIISRIKDRDECIRKFTIKYQKRLEEKRKPYEIKDYISDLIGVRIICLYEDEISITQKTLENNFEVIGVTDKTSSLEAREDTFGYKGVHLDLSLNQPRRDLPENKKFQSLRFEVQIRTIIQDSWSVLDHKMKYKKSIPLILKRRINRLAALFELADQEFLNIRDHTLKLEKEVQEEVASLSAISHEEEVLDAFTFLATMRGVFPNYDFTPRKVDGFVEEILMLRPNFTHQSLQAVVSKYLQTVDAYKAYQLIQYSRKQNPYTMVRHMLYLSDKKPFHSILFNRQRESFEEWLQNKKAKSVK
jgi:putative GTP pyrophosphokinase